MTRSLAITAALLCAISISACATQSSGPKTAETRQPLGKIHLKYQYGQSDIENPPIALNVYRAQVSAGPFQKINQRPVTPIPNARPGDVQLLITDAALPLGQDFYYYIEKIDRNGAAHKATSTARGTISIPMEATKAESGSQIAPLQSRQEPRTNPARKTSRTPTAPATK